MQPHAAPRAVASRRSRLEPARHSLHAIFIVLACVTALSAQASHTAHRIPSAPEELLSRPLTLRQGIGRAHDGVSTASPEAQAFYDQGLAYLHSFVWIDAARSFDQALGIDPGLALAHVGLSYAFVEMNQPSRARGALDRAQALAQALPDHDRRHVELRTAQMLAEDAPGDPARLAAYRAALDRALQAFPGDVELWLLRGIAESPDPGDRGQGSPLSAAPFFEKAMSIAPGHFAAHHYLTHAFENAGRLADALKNGAAYANAAPAIPHALHMHGHVLRRTGAIDEAIAAFEQANRLEAAYLETEKIPAELEWHHEHNLDLLASSYRYLGQAARAERILKAAFEVPSALVVQMFNKRGWPEFLLARGRHAEALDAARILAAHPEPLVRATGHVTAGRALMASGNFKAAAGEINAALKDLQGRPGGGLVGPAFEHAQGEFFLRTSPKEKGRAMLREVARKVRQAPGPDNWVQALFTLEAIARAARETGDWDLAAWAATAMRDHDDRYGGTHYALGLVAAHNGDSAGAKRAFAEAERLWSTADGDLRELLEIRKGK